jgi:hypothetical protein
MSIGVSRADAITSFDLLRKWDFALVLSPGDLVEAFEDGHDGWPLNREQCRSSIHFMKNWLVLNIFLYDRRSLINGTFAPSGAETR